MRMRWVRRGAIAVAVLGVASLAVGAMGGTSFDRASKLNAGLAPGGSPSGEYAPVPHQASQFAAGLTSEAVGDGDDLARSARAVLPQAGPAVPGFGDRVIRTADMQVEVKEGRFDAAWDSAYAIASRFGGEIVGASRGNQAPETRVLSGMLTIRVPSDKLDAAMREFSSALGEVRAQQTSSEDVSQEFIDLQARLRNLRAERAALLALYDRAGSIRATLAVQSRLSEVQGEIEQVSGRINFIESRTDFATITLTIAEPGAGVLLLTTEDGPSFAAAWDTAVEGLVRIATTAMITAVWLAPFVLIAAVVIGMWRRTRPSPQA